MCVLVSRIGFSSLQPACVCLCFVSLCVVCCVLRVVCCVLCDACYVMCVVCFVDICKAHQEAWFHQRAREMQACACICFEESREQCSPLPC